MALEQRVESPEVGIFFLLIDRFQWNAKETGDEDKQDAVRSPSSDYIWAQISMPESTDIPCQAMPWPRRDSSQRGPSENRTSIKRGVSSAHRMLPFYDSICHTKLTQNARSSFQRSQSVLPSVTLQKKQQPLGHSTYFCESTHRRLPLLARFRVRLEQTGDRRTATLHHRRQVGRPSPRDHRRRQPLATAITTVFDFPRISRRGRIQLKGGHHACQQRIHLVVPLVVILLSR